MKHKIKKKMFLISLLILLTCCGFENNFRPFKSYITLELLGKMEDSVIKCLILGKNVK